MGRGSSVLPPRENHYRVPASSNRVGDRVSNAELQAGVVQAAPRGAQDVGSGETGVVEHDVRPASGVYRVVRLKVDGPVPSLA